MPLTDTSPDLRSGAYYVTVRRSDGSTIYALGPFTRHRRALGLVDTLRRRVVAAGLDPWLEFGYGTARVQPHHGMPVGALNPACHVGADFGGVVLGCPQLGVRVLERFAEVGR